MQEAQLRRLRALGIPGELGGTFPSVPQYSGPLFQLVCVLSIKEAGAETEIRVPEEDVAGVLHSIAGVGFCYFEGRRKLGSFPDGVPTTGKGWHTAALWKGADTPGGRGTSEGTPAHVALEPSVKS